MTQRVFQHAIDPIVILMISTTWLFGSTNQSCHDDYSANSFEEVNYELRDFIDEYFADQKITFLPKTKDAKSLGLKNIGNGVYITENPYISAGRGKYPFKKGIWKMADIGDGVVEIHLLVKEPHKLAETEAFNSLNDFLGEPFADYDNQAYIMIPKPEDIRRRYGNTYFTINVSVFGIDGDATELNSTVTDITFSDYTAWVEANKRCKNAKGGTDENTPSRR